MARMTREAKRQETLGKLRQAALQEFAQAGLAGTSIDRITAAAGFSRGAFYANYSTKEELLLELLREQTQHEIGEWQLILRGATDLDAVYSRTSERFTAFLRDADWGVFAAEVQLHAKRHAAFSTQYQAYVEEVLATLGQMIELLFRKAGRRPPADAVSIARLLRSVVAGLSLDVQSLAAPDRAQEASALLMLFLRNLIESGAPIAARGRARATVRVASG